ncbi:MAG: FKBP-type peptidyl-prolyl cis-trans isomerase [Chitinophagales bacterium]
MKNNVVMMFVAILMMTSCNAQTGHKEDKKVNLEEMTAEQKASYSYGILLADNLKRGNFEGLDAELIGQAIKDVLSGSETLLDVNAATVEWQVYAQTQQAKQQEKDAAKFNENKEAGEKFLEENKSKEGVVVLPSGLQYKIITKGDGPIPGPNDKVKTHYHGTLIDGTVFDSSVERGEPISFPVGGVIAGWTEALQLMPVGSKWELYIPYDLAYGARRAGEKIAPYSALVFEVELLGIE